VIGLTIRFELDDSATDWLTRSVETMRKMFQIGIAAISMLVLIYGPTLARGLRDLDRGRGVGIPAAAESLLIQWILEIVKRVEERTRHGLRIAIGGCARESVFCY
jgi:hypothetical protein